MVKSRTTARGEGRVFRIAKEGAKGIGGDRKSSSGTKRPQRGSLMDGSPAIPTGTGERAGPRLAGEREEGGDGIGEEDGGGHGGWQGPLLAI